MRDCMLMLLITLISGCGSFDDHVTQGPPGPTGPRGQQGATGATGPKGEQGYRGEPGPAGKDGAPGTTGPAGPAGARGVMGPQGYPGAQGPGGALHSKADTYAVSETVFVQGQADAATTARCTSDIDIVLNGGCAIGADVQAWLTISRPVQAVESTAFSGWECRVRNRDALEVALTVSATCLTVRP